jgi:hypothetical protein
LSAEWSCPVLPMTFDVLVRDGGVEQHINTFIDAKVWQ